MPVLLKPQYTDYNTTVDLDGSEGNAFALIGIVKQLAAQIGWDRDKVDAVIADMMSGNYAHLVKTMDRELGYVLNFITSDKSLIDEIDNMPDYVDTKN